MEILSVRAPTIYNRNRPSSMVLSLNSKYHTALSIFLHHFDTLANKIFIQVVQIFVYLFQNTELFDYSVALVKTSIRYLLVK